MVPDTVKVVPEAIVTVVSLPRLLPKVRLGRVCDPVIVLVTEINRTVPEPAIVPAVYVQLPVASTVPEIVQMPEDLLIFTTGTDPAPLIV